MDWAEKVGSFRFYNFAVNFVYFYSEEKKHKHIDQFHLPLTLNAWFVILKSFLLRIAYVRQDWRNQQISPVKAWTKHGSYTIFKLLCYRLAFVQNKRTQEGKYWPRKRNSLSVTHEYLSIYSYCLFSKNDDLNQPIQWDFRFSQLKEMLEIVVFKWLNEWMSDFGDLN